MDVIIDQSCSCKSFQIYWERTLWPAGLLPWDKSPPEWETVYGFRKSKSTKLASTDFKNECINVVDACELWWEHLHISVRLGLCWSRHPFLKNSLLLPSKRRFLQGLSHTRHEQQMSSDRKLNMDSL